MRKTPECDLALWWSAPDDGAQADEPQADEPQADEPQEECGPIGGCLYVGLARDRDTRFEFPRGDHLCWAVSGSEPIDASFQAEMCLTTEHVRCMRFRSKTWHLDSGRGGRPK
jgi:hypothetical protein